MDPGGEALMVVEAGQETAGAEGRGHIFNNKYKAEGANWKGGETVSSRPWPVMFFLLQGSAS